MVKNKLEKKFSESLKASEFWGMKLHNNMLAHQTTPADYIMSYTAKEGVGLKPGKLWLFLVECKQVTLKEGKGRLAFKRLKQMHDLLAFEKQSKYHKSYFCISYNNSRWDQSEVYLIPVQEMKKLIEKWNMVSLNRKDASDELNTYRMPMYKNKLSFIQLIA